MFESYMKFNMNLNDRTRKIIMREDSKEEVSADQDDKSGDSETKTASEPAKLDILKFIHSKVLNEGVREFSETHVNTISFVLTEFKKYLMDSKEDQSYTDKIVRGKRVYPYLLLNLSKEIGLVDDYGLTNMGTFYEANAGWNHDDILIIVMQMIKLGMPVSFEIFHPNDKSEIDPLEDNAVYL